jgi:hypothetical protein
VGGHGSQDEAGSAGGKRQSPLKSLSTFLTLQKAEAGGFDAGKYGLSNDQAAEIATVFSRRGLFQERAACMWRPGAHAEPGTARVPVARSCEHATRWAPAIPGEHGMATRRFDENDDMVLEPMEVRRLMCARSALPPAAAPLAAPCAAAMLMRIA